MPELTLSLPIALVLLAVFLAIGALALYFTLKATHSIQVATAVPSITATLTETPTPTDTLIPTETPTLTPEPPLEYSVKAGDNCGSIAALFGSSVQAIIQLNGLNSNCTNLAIGQTVKVPRPTPTPLPLPTDTPLPADATRIACNKQEITVMANDTLSKISANWGVSMTDIKTFNGLSTDSVFIGQKLLIPLCMRAATPGPTPTATIPPPYPAPNLLLPADGASFTLANDTVTLQWASVGALRENEAYQVTVEDITDGTGRKIVEYATDTKFIVPVSFRPQDSAAHIIRWKVTTVRQSGTDDQGNQIWVTAGAVSVSRDFSWSGAGTAAPTPTK